MVEESVSIIKLPRHRKSRLLALNKKCIDITSCTTLCMLSMSHIATTWAKKCWESRKIRKPAEQMGL